MTELQPSVKTKEGLLDVCEAEKKNSSYLSSDVNISVFV